MVVRRNREGTRFTRRKTGPLIPLLSMLGMILAQPAKAVPPVLTGGSAFSVAIPGDGAVWSWGSNDRGQLGDGTFLPRAVPGQIGVFTSWNEAASGSGHTIALRNGALWAWGTNTSGQLGDGTTIDRNTPIRIGADSNWWRLSATADQSLGIKLDGTLWAWGKNTVGQLGDGTTINRLAPVRVGTATNWTKVAAGNEHSIGLTSNGTLWAWGSNTSGQLGVGNTISSAVPVVIPASNGWVDFRPDGYTLLREGAMAPSGPGVRTPGASWVMGQRSTNPHRIE